MVKPVSDQGFHKGRAGYLKINETLSLTVRRGLLIEKAASWRTKSVSAVFQSTVLDSEICIT